MCFSRASIGISPLTLWPWGLCKPIAACHVDGRLVPWCLVVGWWLGLHWGARKGEAWSKLFDLMGSSRLICQANHDPTKLCLA
ncbi:hypothetical protein GQ55_9G118300 [Panicum hallii var. hallii]|uniref:Uncharacterized protein n=1 Tax=Panicum hallii var. hallii TaxID=1504633 RepID=A0A2T7C242_9POAL|nr:hypothetical protein GQ55_9G118300 [Panicum hallii var. hallii]